MAYQAPDLVAAMRPGTGKLLAEERIEGEGGDHDRHHPAGGAAHSLEDEEDQRDAEGDVPVVRRSVAVPDFVAALEYVRDHGYGSERRRPVPPHDAVAVALRDRKQQVAEEQHEADVHRAQHPRSDSSRLLGAHASTARPCGTLPALLIRPAGQAADHQGLYRFSFSARGAPNRQGPMTPTPRVDSSHAPACRPASRQWPDSGALPGIRWSGLAHARERRRLWDNSLSGGDRA